MEAMAGLVAGASASSAASSCPGTSRAALPGVRASRGEVREQERGRRWRSCLGALGASLPPQAPGLADR
eukprot:2731327-Heterocapsa_arctica.AAC.1